MRALLTLGAALLPLLLAPVAAEAAPTTKRPPAAPGRAHSLEEVSLMLSSAEAHEVRSALESAAQLPPRQARPVVEERIRAGLPPVLLDVAIDTLLLLDDQGASPLLVELATHRRPEVRQRALEALTQLHAQGAERTLVHALGDQDAEVRSAAASGLGELAAHGAFERLFAAQQRGVPGAAAALGKVARADDVERLLELVGSAPLDVVAPLCEALFTRRDLAEPDKLRLTQKLAELETSEARALRDELLAKLPREASPRLRRALAADSPKGAN